MTEEKELREVNARLGKKLSKLRKQEGLSMRDFAKEIGVSQNSIWFYEHGKRAPTLDKLLKIADYFCVSVDELIRPENPATENKAGTKIVFLNGGSRTVIDVTDEDKEELKRLAWYLAMKKSFADEH